MLAKRSHRPQSHIPNVTHQMPFHSLERKVACVEGLVNKLIILFIHVGCWLGDPNTHINEGKKTWIVDGDEKKIAMAESMSDTPAKLAVAILTALFSMEELGAGCCTQAKDRNTLNPVYIRGIRSKLHRK